MLLILLQTVRLFIYSRRLTEIVRAQEKRRERKRNAATNAPKPLCTSESHIYTTEHRCINYRWSLMRNIAVSWQLFQTHVQFNILCKCELSVDMCFDITADLGRASKPKLQKEKNM